MSCRDSRSGERQRGKRNRTQIPDTKKNIWGKKFELIAQPKRSVLSALCEFERVSVNDRNGERSVSVPSRRVRPASKCSGSRAENIIRYKDLQPIHQIAAVIRFREFGPQRTVSGLFMPNEVNSPIFTTLENKKKIRGWQQAENELVRSSGGGNGTRVEPSLNNKLLLLHWFLSPHKLNTP